MVTATECSGFLLFEDCTVVVADISQPRKKKKQWMDVHIQHDNNNADTAAAARLQVGIGCVCPHCELILYCPADENERQEEYLIDLPSTGSFGGTLADLVPTGCSVCGSQEKKTDAALAAAFIRECCTTASIDVRLQVLLHDEGGGAHSATLGSVVQHQQPCRRAAASLVWHVAFPNAAVERSILKSGNTQSRKVLSQSLQLLLLLLENDVTDLESRMQALREKRPELSETTFFPIQFRLESMYQRIIHRDRRRQQQPLASRARETIEDISTRTAMATTTLSLSTLPTELLTIHIAPFCNATALAHWRACNRHFHRILRAVVPGLRLRLYQHQIDSLMWMRTRERPLAEDSCWGQQHDATTRAITGGAMTRLGSVVLDTTTGRVVSEPPPAPLRRHVAQGGLLCDDPGLGKTITVLALVLQTSPESMRIATGNEDEEPSSPTKEDSIDDPDRIFHAYWSEHVVLEYRIRALLKLLNELARTAPLSLSEVFYPLRKAIESNHLGADFAAFARAVEETICTVEVPGDVGSKHCNHGSLTAAFRNLVAEFKASQQRSARRSFSNASSKPNSSVAALIEERTRQRHLQSLRPTKGTLIVTPSVLIDHWKQQIERHIDFRYLTRRHALVFEYLPRGQGMTVDRATILCDLEKTHDAAVFLDKAGTRPLPPAAFLSKFRIVVTSTNRFQNEWKNGSFQQELEQAQSDAGEGRVSFAHLVTRTESIACCELLKVHWNRMVIDEGHSMGNDRSNATIQFASSICSHRRWAMTGTPTKQSAAQLGQLNRLLSFLEHDFFTPRLDGHIYWKKHIAAGWRAGCIGKQLPSTLQLFDSQVLLHPASYFRIYHLLCFMMKRHTKLDIIELPPPVFSHTRIPMSFTECTTYNTFVSSVQLNLLMTSMEGKTSGAQDSLLHRSQTKSARSTLQSIRRVCTGFARAIPTVSEVKHAEFLQIANASGLPEAAVMRLCSYVHRAKNEELTRCDCCRLELSIVVLMVCCGGLICTECMDSKTKRCYLCDASFDVDELQQFQPGFIVAWKEDQNIDSSGSLVPVEHQVQLTKPSSSPSVAPPIVRPPKVRRKSRRIGDGHDCRYDPFAADGICDLCLVEHEHCNLMNKRFRCVTCHRYAEGCPKDESKSSYLVEKLLQLHKDHLSRVELVRPIRLPDRRIRPLKVIVFSQFRAALNVVGHRLLKRFGTACVAEYFGKHRREELQKFSHSTECFVLLLTKDGGEGLDLSFVTNIFFLEEIYDKAVQHQAVARAWRMGAIQSVQVQTLVARNSVEETMVQQTKPTADSEPIIGAAEKQRLKTLLQSLRCITDFHNFAAETAPELTKPNTPTSPVRAPKEPPKRKRDPAAFQVCATAPSKRVKFDLPD